MQNAHIENETPEEYHARISAQLTEQMDYQNELDRIVATYKQLEQRVAALETK